MYADARKIHLIEKMLKITDENTLKALEITLSKSSKQRAKKGSIYDFVGILTKKEANDMRNAISETAEIIHADDWK
jgi:hypothetical protein